MISSTELLLTATSKALKQPKGTCIDVYSSLLPLKVVESSVFSATNWGHVAIQGSHCHGCKADINDLC